MAPLAVSSGPPVVRDKPLGAPAFVGLVYCKLKDHWVVIFVRQKSLHDGMMSNARW